MSFAPDPLGQARFLLERNRAAEARDVLAPAMARGLASAPAHSLMAFVLHQLGDNDGCERELRAALRLTPDDGAAEFALAWAVFRRGDDAEAEAATRRAIAKGMDDVHSHLLLGRILSRQGRSTDAEVAYRAAIRRDPASPDTQRELAELIWSVTGDLAKARAALDAAPQTTDIVSIAVRLTQDAGDAQGAWELAAARAAHNPALAAQAARAGLRFDPQAADRLLAASPPNIRSSLRARVEIEVDLALSRAAQAVRRAEALHTAQPADQYVTALLATAWRLAGDERYRALYDYDRLVKTYIIDAPEGWSSLDTYLNDLGAALDRIHAPLAHPLAQSVRHGSQTTRNLTDYDDPAIRALFGAIDGPIRRHITAIGAGAQAYRLRSAWSVRLNSGGFHINHVHPEGWLSSAFYVRRPTVLNGTEGFLQFGEPGPPTLPPLPAEHLVEPQPGKLVLFPSYMWHGTVPFASEEKRLSCAFDIVRG